jgi:hypothetical protein
MFLILCGKHGKQGVLGGLTWNGWLAGHGLAQHSLLHLSAFSSGLAWMAQVGWTWRFWDANRSWDITLGLL